MLTTEQLKSEKYDAKAQEVYAVLQDAVEKLEKLEFFQPELDKVISAYEFVIDAVGYGFPGAVFEGWETPRRMYNLTDEQVAALRQAARTAQEAGQDGELIAAVEILARDVH